jgi:hypothetical protein
MEQTAVEWLKQELKERYGSINLIEPLFKQAKEMFEQQIEDAWENGYEHGACVNEDKNKYHGIQYYNETFKQKP